MKTYQINEAMDQRIKNDFTYHKPKEGQDERYVFLRDEAKTLATNICKLTPTSREQSLALSKLEEAVFYANAAIARNE